MAFFPTSLYRGSKSPRTDDRQVFWILYECIVSPFPPFQISQSRHTFALEFETTFLFFPVSRFKLKEAVSQPFGLFPTATTRRWPLGSHFEIIGWKSIICGNFKNWRHMRFFTFSAEICSLSKISIFKYLGNSSIPWRNCKNLNSFCQISGQNLKICSKISYPNWSEAETRIILHLCVLIYLGFTKDFQ